MHSTCRKYLPLLKPKPKPNEWLLPKLSNVSLVQVIEAMLEQCLRTDVKDKGESRSALAGHVATFALDQLWASLQDERERQPVRKAVEVSMFHGSL